MPSSGFPRIFADDETIGRVIRAHFEVRPLVDTRLGPKATRMRRARGHAPSQDFSSSAVQQNREESGGNLTSGVQRPAQFPTALARCVHPDATAKAARHQGRIAGPLPNRGPPRRGSEGRASSDIIASPMARRTPNISRAKSLDLPALTGSRSRVGAGFRIPPR